MQKPIDTTGSINQLLLRVSKSFNTLGEREAMPGVDKLCGGKTNRSCDDEIVCRSGVEGEWRWMEPDGGKL